MNNKNSSLKTISEVSNIYNISSRMLRYYEEKGLIKSIRKDNNYRQYNFETEEKIKQILLLKELQFTTKEIESLYTNFSTYELIQLLYRKKQELHDSISLVLKLESIITDFISLLNTSNNPIFDSLSHTISNHTYSKKGIEYMKSENLRIVTLPKMKVAVLNAFSNSPEDDVANIANAFIKKENLTSFRHFGFNNPNPSKDQSQYGYEIWITVDKEYEGIKTRNVKEGLYASLTTFMPNIGSRWNELYQLVVQSKKYELNITTEIEPGVNEHQWLEECTNYSHFYDESIDFSDKQLDLLLPIKRL